MDLDTPLSNLLRATYDLELPARFYNPRTLKRIQDTSLIKIYEKGIGNLSIDNIAASYILDTLSANPATVISVLKEFGSELATRFGIDNRYANYSTAELMSDRAIWETTVRAQKEYERLLSRRIDEINDYYMQFPAYPLSKPNVQQSNLVYTKVSWNASYVDLSKLKTRDVEVQPIVDRVRLTNEDALDIFTLIPVSDDIPYLGYHTPLADHYRVSINPQTLHTHPDRDEYTYRIISDSDLYSDLRGSTAFLSFIILGVFCLLDLSHSTLILNRIDHSIEETITQKIQDKLDFLNIEGLTHRHITARIISPIGGPIIYHLFLFDAMLNQEEYIGFKEEETPQVLKPTNLFYLSPIPRIVNPLTDEYAQIPEIKVEINKGTAVSSELFTLFTKEQQPPYELKSGTTYTEFTVFNVTDAALLRFATAYLSRMVGHYHEVVVKEYSEFIHKDFRLPLLTTSSPQEEDTAISSSSEGGGGGIKAIDILSHSYPEVFANNYTRRCPHYPIVKDKLDGDVEYKIGANDNSSAGKWLRFPPDGNIEFYFRCGTREPDFMHPGVIVSNLRNKTKYPLLPCCFRSEQFKPGQRTEIAYRLGGATASSVRVTDITVSSWGPLNYPPIFNRRLLMTSDKQLSRGRIGTLPQAISNVIMSNILVSTTTESSDQEEDEEDYKIVRLGLSEPTMVHAVFLAVDPEYQKLSTASLEERTEYIRSHLKFPNPACLYQELSPQDAADKNIFSTWDTTTHYRILEEALDINLYVILRITPPENVNRPDRYFFEIPRTRSGEPHMRRHNLNRPSVILYKVRKFEIDIPIDSGIELVLFATPLQIRFSGVWGPMFTKRIAELYIRSNQVLSFGTNPVDEEAYGKYVGYYTIDYRSLIPQQPVSQIIDERGLCRALNFDSFSVVFPATQPYDLPFSSTLKRAESYNEIVKKIFGNACLISSAKDGVFYIIGGNSYIFIPCDNIIDDEQEKNNIVHYTPLTGLETTDISHNIQWRKAYVQLKILLFLVAFIFVFSETRDPNKDPNTNSINFMNKYVTLDETKHKSSVSEIYDFSNLKRVFILKDPTLKSALSILNRFVPSLLNASKDKIVLTSRKIYEGIAYYIRTVADQTAAYPASQLRKTRWELGRILETSLTTADINTLYFNSPGYVRMWFKGNRTLGSSLASNVKTVFDTVKTGSGIAIWRHPVTQRVWLIPGVTYSFRNAAAVCYLWLTQHRVVELERHTETLASIEKLQSGGSNLGSKAASGMTIFKYHHQDRRTRSRTRTRLIVNPEDDIELISEAKRIIETSEDNIAIFTYVITRDNRIELLNDGTEMKQINLEVLRTAINRFTPMLSP